MQRLYRNYLDARFCPVFWLFAHKNENMKNKGGPLWDDCGRTYAWHERLVNFMRKAIKKDAVTVHSIRRGAAAWAARCGVDSFHIMATGRWSTYEVCLTYVKAGMQEKEEHRHSQDPVFQTWVYKPTFYGLKDRERTA